MKYMLFITLALLGCRGNQGIQGPTGLPGSPGTPGIPGSSISFYTTPATTQECPTGGTDIILSQDSFNPNPWGIGPQPYNGLTQAITICNGMTGPAGINASQVIPIQFCNNASPTYPSNFPEYGLCINNTIYGVYSQNGGFLAELPPGTYNSDGINASCTFTIKSNCNVSN